MQKLLKWSELEAYQIVTAKLTHSCKNASCVMSLSVLLQCLIGTMHISHRVMSSSQAIAAYAATCIAAALFLDELRLLISIGQLAVLPTLVEAKPKVQVDMLH